MLQQCALMCAHSQRAGWVPPRFFLLVSGNCFKSTTPCPDAPKMKFILTADMNPDLIGDIRNKTAVSHEKVCLLAPC